MPIQRLSNCFPENVQSYEVGNQTLTNVTDIFTQTENPMSISIGVDNDSKELKESAMDTSKKDGVEVYATAVFINSLFQCLIEEEWQSFGKCITKEDHLARNIAKTMVDKQISCKLDSGKFIHEVEDNAREYTQTTIHQESYNFV